jgi:hypothetical protein
MHRAATDGIRSRPPVSYPLDVPFMPGLLPYRFLFRYRFTVRRKEQLPPPGRAVFSLSEEHRLPNLGELDGAKSFADIRLAWNDKGLALSVEVTGKSRGLLSCIPNNPQFSDGVQVWIDTRNTQNIHRASRFCHHFCLLPGGAGGDRKQPMAAQQTIARAKELSPMADPRDIEVASEITRSGWRLSAWISAKALHGYDPEAQPLLGFYCLVRDTELREQALTVGGDFPFAYDPSLWATLELTN